MSNYAPWSIPASSKRKQTTSKITWTWYGSLDSKRCSKMSMLAPYAIKQSRSISPRRRPIKKKILSKGKQERVQGQSHTIAEYYSVAKPPSRFRPSVGCLVNYTRGPCWLIRGTDKLYTQQEHGRKLLQCSLNSLGTFIIFYVIIPKSLNPRCLPI